MLSRLGPSWGHLGLSWSHLEAIFGHLGAISGQSWSHLGANLVHLGPSWAIFKPSRAIWGFLKPLYHHFWGIYKNLDFFSWFLKVSRLSEAILGPSRGYLEPSRDHVWATLAYLGRPVRSL